MQLPRYDELPIRPGLPPRSAWGVWGDHDQVGSINLLTEERARRAAGLATQGKVFSLNWALEQPSPAFYGRAQFKHNIEKLLPNIMDDSVDGLFTQASSTWNALCHIGHPEYGYWNGVDEASFTGGHDTKNGIEHWARKGIVGRGVLLDVAAHWGRTGRTIDGGTAVEFTVEDLDEVRAAQGVEFEVGDILLIRTGWMRWYEHCGQDTRRDLSEDSINRLRSPGLAGGEDTAEWLWNNHFSAVVADNPAVEAWPHDLEVDKYLHFRLIPLLGFALGEMWYLEELAADCERDGRFDFLLTSSPLNLRGGVGSPPNALAIK